MPNIDKTVFIVHAIDTEGPLHEPLKASFERLEELFQIGDLPRTHEILVRLQNQEIDLGGKEVEVARLLRGHRINYMNSWPKVEAMLDRVMNHDFRMRQPDSFGGGWVYNWFCLDHVEFKSNPRRRTMGYHAIHDHYAERVSQDRRCTDEIQWHFHPMSFYREAHRCATSYINSPHLYETLARRVIERNFFPAVFRAGFQAERPDSNLFLEQWIPFDISNTATDPSRAWTDSVDLRKGRSGDWRRAPCDWTPYHPDHDNYQLRGNCRRWIGRSLNLLNRFANLDEMEVEKAFAQAAEGRPTIMGVCSHDFRDLQPEVEYVRDLIERVRGKYPSVRFKYSRASTAFQDALSLPVEAEPPLELSVNLEREPVDDVPNLTVSVERGRTFGPQPFLAIETKGKRFLHDNLDFDVEDGRWFYAFHEDTLPISDVSRLGIAANDPYGRTCIRVLSV
jgi:hypothetical protein